MSVSNNKSIVTDGLTYYVDPANKASYAGSGTDLNDLIRDKDGTLTNGPSFSSDNGGIIDYDGVNDHVLTTFDDMYSYMDEFTISYWIKTTQTGIGTVLGVASGDTGAPDYFSEVFSVVINHNATTATSGYTRLFLRDAGPSTNGSGLNTCSSAFQCNCNDGDWHNVVIVYENTSTPLTVGYVDGVSKTAVYRSGNRDQINTAWVRNPSDRDPALGATHGRDDVLGNYFDGSLACVSLYDRALTSDEVTQNYEALKNRFE